MKRWIYWTAGVGVGGVAALTVDPLGFPWPGATAAVLVVLGAFVARWDERRERQRLTRARADAARAEQNWRALDSQHDGPAWWPTGGER